MHPHCGLPLPGNDPVVSRILTLSGNLIPLRPAPLGYDPVVCLTLTSSRTLTQPGSLAGKTSPSCCMSELGLALADEGYNNARDPAGGCIA